MTNRATCVCAWPTAMAMSMVQSKWERIHEATCHVDKGMRAGINDRISNAAFSAMEHATVRSAEWRDGSGSRMNASTKGLH